MPRLQYGMFHNGLHYVHLEEFELYYKWTDTASLLERDLALSQSANSRDARHYRHYKVDFLNDKLRFLSLVLQQQRLALAIRLAFVL